MDQRLKHIADNMEKMKLGADDTFRFSCKQCGKCCINRDDIILTPFDLFRASKKLNMAPHEFIKEYCESYIGDSSRMVVVRLKPRGSIKRCPLLKDRKCMVHDSKPGVCAMYPIGRGFMIKAGKYTPESINFENVIYFFNGAHCGNDETHTVREWFASFGIPIEDEFFIEWQKTVTELHNIIEIAEKNFAKESTLESLWNGIYVALYQDYDITKEFLPQFLSNRDKLMSFLRTIPQFYLGGKKNVG